MGSPFPLWVTEVALLNLCADSECGPKVLSFLILLPVSVIPQRHLFKTGHKLDLKILQHDSVASFQHDKITLTLHSYPPVHEDEHVTFAVVRQDKDRKESSNECVYI